MAGISAMCKLFFVAVILFISEGVNCDICYWTPSYGSQATEYCTWGCCYSYIYPCCDEPFYYTAAFIVPIVLGSVFLFVCVVVVIIVIVRRRRMTPVQYGQTIAAPQVIATNTAGTTYGGYSNPQFGAPVYGMQHPNGAPPVYTTQYPNGAPPMYPNQPINGAPPMYQTMYPAQVPGGVIPNYGAQAPAGGAPPYPAKPVDGAALPDTTQPPQ